jgi:hypothetical protein
MLSMIPMRIIYENNKMKNAFIESDILGAMK